MRRQNLVGSGFTSVSAKKLQPSQIVVQERFNIAFGALLSAGRRLIALGRPLALLLQWGLLKTSLQNAKRP